MALHFEIEEFFPLPPSETFAALCDLDGVRHWMPNFVGLERVAGAGFEVGTAWKETRKMFGKEATEHFEVVSLDPPVHLGLRVDGSKGASRRGEYLFDYYLHPQEGGTRVVLRGVIRGMGRIGELIGGFMMGSFRKACARDLAALKAHVAGGGEG